MGASGFADAGVALHRPDGRDLRPARRRAQHARPTPPTESTPDAARRRPAPPDRRRSTPVRSTCSRAAAAPSTRWPSWPRTRRTSGRSSRTSRRWPEILPDREAALAACRGHPRHVPARRHGPAMAKFIAHRQLQGRDRRPTTPSSPRRTRRCSACRPRTTARATTPCSGRTSSRALPARLRRPPAASTAIVIARRRGVGGELAHRGGGRSPSGWASTPALFPSDHGGFLGDEYGQPGKPDEFAAKLREVLAANA